MSYFLLSLAFLASLGISTTKAMEKEKESIFGGEDTVLIAGEASGEDGFTLLFHTSCDEPAHKAQGTQTNPGTYSNDNSLLDNAIQEKMEALRKLLDAKEEQLRKEKAEETLAHVRRLMETGRQEAYRILLNAQASRIQSTATY